MGLPVLFFAVAPVAAVAAVTIPSALTATAAVVTILTALVAALAFTYRTVRRIEDGLGADKNGRTLSDRMDRVEHQLWPNGGSSLADVVHRTDRAVVEARAEVRVTRDLLAKIIETR